MIRKPIVQTPHTHNGQVLNRSQSIHKAKLIEINEPLCKMNVIIEILTQEEARGWAPAEKNMTFNRCYLYWITGRSEKKKKKKPPTSWRCCFLMHLSFICLGTRSLVILVFPWSKAINYWQTKSQCSVPEQTIIYSCSYLLSCLAFLFLTCGLKRRNWLCEAFLPACVSSE